MRYIRDENLKLRISELILILKNLSYNIIAYIFIPCLIHIAGYADCVYYINKN